jgi:hypothetical protein
VSSLGATPTLASGPDSGDWLRPLRSNGRRFARALDDGPEKTRALHLVAAA